MLEWWAILPTSIERSPVMTRKPQQARRLSRTQGRPISAPIKLAGFAAILVALFGVAALAGGALDPDRDESATGHGGADTVSDAGHPGSGAHLSERAATGEGGTTASPGADKTAQSVRGLAVAENGLRLVVDERELPRGQTANVRFRIIDERGRTVRDFDVEHTKRMHLIVVRRDLSAFEHLHPEQDRDGSWSVRLRLPNAGSYRLFADFSRQGQPFTLASDLHVDGRADLRPLPAPAAESLSDGGYRVRLDAGRARPGEEAALRFAITKDGRPVQTEPYLGAGGHLVALRDGDLAFLHVHPSDHGHDAAEGTAHGESVAFAATFPTKGRYRLFLQFKHEGTVQTVAFTQGVK